MAQVIEFAIRAKDEASAKLKLIQNTTKELDSQFKLLNPTVLGVSIGFAALVASGVKAIKAFEESELATKKLTDAMKQAGIFTQAYANHLSEFATGLQATTRFSDEQVASVQQLLITFGIYGTMLDKTTKATLDLAETLGIDAESAARMMAKAAEGNTQALRRYGIVVDENIPKSQQLAAAVQLITDKMGGRAAGAGDTVTGSITQAKNALSDMMEQIGGFIAKSTPFMAAIKGITELFKGLAGGTQREKLTTELKMLEDTYAAQSKHQVVNREQLDEIYDRLLKTRNELAKINKEEKTGLDLAERKSKEYAEQQKALAEAAKMQKILTQLEADKIDLMGKQSNTVQQTLMFMKNQLQNSKELTEEELKRLNAMERARQLEEGSSLRMASSFSGASATGLAGSSMEAMGLGGGVAAAIAVGITELVLHAGELPDKLSSMIQDLSRGLAEGIPKLIDYLGNNFIPELVNGLTVALAGLIKNAPGMILDGAKLGIRSGLAFATGGISEAFGAIGGMFGGGKSKEEHFDDVIKSLADKLAQLANSIRDTILSIRFSMMSPDQQVSSLQRTIRGSNLSMISDAAAFTEAARSGNTELAAQELENLQNEIQTQIKAYQQLFDIQNRQIDDIIAKETELYNTRVKQAEAIRQFAQAALDSFRSAREAILGALLGPTGNLSRLRQNFSSAGTPEARAAAASALAGGLQGSVSAAQNLASQGAITGEELARIQQNTVSELDQLIAAQQSVVNAADLQIQVLKSGFEAFVAQQEAQRQELKDYFTRQIDQLDNIYTELKSSRGGFNLSSFRENTGNTKGQIRGRN